ncbi:MAG: alpha/beta hydrolase [Novosphingobium sp.]
MRTIGHLSRLPDERPGIGAPPRLAALRQAVAQAVGAGTWRTDPPAREMKLGGTRALAFAPHGTAKATLVHFHGGGYGLGAPEMAGPYAAALAERCGVEVICPQYRLAPDYPLPAGLNDGLKVVEALRDAGCGQLILSGDSAGGGLAASLTALCVADGIKVAGLVLLSAWLDLTVSSDCYDANAASDPLFSRASAQDSSGLYLQGWPADDPLASPLFANLAGFPPTLVSAGAGEVLFEDSRRFHAALEAAGVPAELSVIPDMEHTAVIRDKSLVGAAETFDIVARFIDRLLADRSSR